MEKEAPDAHDKVAYEGDLEDKIVVIFATAADALDPKVHKKQVGESVHNLRGVNGCIVVL